MRVLRIAALIAAVCAIPAARATAEPPPVTALQVHAEDAMLVSNVPAINAVAANINLLGTVRAVADFHAVRIATGDLRSTHAALAFVQSAASSTTDIASAPVDNDSGHGWLFWTILVAVIAAAIYGIYRFATRTDSGDSSGRSRSG